MKAYVVVAQGRVWEGVSNVSVHWSNSQCAEKIIALANARLADGSHVDSLGLALRALDNLGVDVATYPVEVEEPKPEPDAHWLCACGAKLDATQTKLSMARSDTAHPACKDCVSKELTFETALDNFLQAIRDLVSAHFTKNFPRLAVPNISVDPNGQKYLRIVKDDGTQRSVFCFVDRASGDILKADGWKRPAKHARGSIYEDAGRGAITPYGVHYITSRGHRNR